MRIPFLIAFILLAVCVACVVTIVWSLDSAVFEMLDSKMDMSDAVLSCLVLLLLAFIPSRKIE